MPRSRSHLGPFICATLLRAASIVVGSAVLAACTVYEPVPYQAPSTYDRAWAAAMGAMQDQGVTSLTVRSRHPDAIETLAESARLNRRV